MKPLCNLHTHTTHCDGRNTAEEMILAAIAANFETIGFSGHSPLEGEDWAMTQSSMAKYIPEVRSLKEKYSDRIEVVLGMEYDILSDCPKDPFEYIIGSVHFVMKNGERLPVDMSAEALRLAVEKHYGGDFYKFSADYYSYMYQLAEKTSCDIVGHFDLLTKFNAGGAFFDESDARYQRYALDALDALLDKSLIFEINTGVIARVNRENPYPADFILRRIAERGGRVMINSDCHTAKWIDVYFPEAVEYARSCGVKELTVFKGGDFTQIGI